MPCRATGMGETGPPTESVDGNETPFAPPMRHEERDGANGETERDTMPEPMPARRLLARWDGAASRGMDGTMSQGG